MKLLPNLQLGEKFMAMQGENSAAAGAGAELFDAGAPPPFKLGDVRAVIPAHCWVKNPWRSLSYALFDFAVSLVLLVAAVYFDSWIFWPVYWPAQGIMFSALFVIGHDCGHGSFSDSTLLNDVVGSLFHTILLVPYFSWQISHRKHHNNHGHVDRDEVWKPLPESSYKKMPGFLKFFVFKTPHLHHLLFGFPLYLVTGFPGPVASHFNPYCKSLFKPKQRKLVIISDICWLLMAGFLYYNYTIIGGLSLLKIYGIPFMIHNTVFAMVTYLHHHGYKEKIPWYRGEEWTYLRGALSTTDQDYGCFKKITHDIGTHVVHHLFPQIPHYHLTESTKEIKKVLGKYYREPKKSRFIPNHLSVYLRRGMRRDHYVSDVGDVVYYQTDYEFVSSKASNKVD